MAVSDLARGRKVDLSRHREIKEYLLLKELPGLGGIEELRRLPNEYVERLLMIMSIMSSVQSQEIENMRKKSK